MRGCPETWQRRGQSLRASTQSARCRRITGGCVRRWTTHCGTSRHTSTQEVSLYHLSSDSCVALEMSIVQQEHR